MWRVLPALFTAFSPICSSQDAVIGAEIAEANPAVSFFGDVKSCAVPARNFRQCREDATDSLFNYAAENIEKTENISLSEYKGNITLVVNLASF